MTTETLRTPHFSRLDPEITARTRARVAQAKATKTQSILEYILFAVFGLTILIAAIALVVTNSAAFRRVPNHVADGVKADRVNVLVMQTYRNRKTDAVTTDALMLMSIKPSTREVAVTSISRDLWVKLGRYGERRIGAATAVGKNAGYPGEGPGLAADTIETVLGQPVHAYVSLDRREMLKAVDALGGIDVKVEQPFFEYKQRIRFTRGVHHLDGERAVQYALSRYVMGPANDRFAREGRQQQVTAALVAKASASENVARIVSARLDERTNLRTQDIAWIANAVDKREPRRVTLAPYMDTFEVATITDTGEAVRPRDGSFEQVRSIVANVFSQTAIAAN